MIFVKAGDIYPITFTANADLTGASLRLLASRNGLSDPLVLASTFVPDVAGGTTVVTHVLDGTLPVGTYRVELEATRGGEVFTFPTGDAINPAYEVLTVVADLG